MQPNDVGPQAIGRRSLLSLAAAAAAIGVAPHQLWAAGQATTPTPFAVMLCDLTLPVTDTPGAVAAGVPAFLPVALQHNLYGATGNELGRVHAQLNRTARRDILNLAAADQASILARLDAAVFARHDPSTQPWWRVKSIILAGYYWSEIGASKELRYDLVPGRYDADIPTPPGTRAMSNDWAGVAFQ